MMRIPKLNFFLKFCLKPYISKKNGTYIFRTVEKVMKSFVKHTIFILLNMHLNQFGYTRPSNYRVIKYYANQSGKREITFAL